MSAVTQCDVPAGSLLAQYGGPADYRDCFYRDVSGVVNLPDFIERFYSSSAFLPERMILRVIAGPSTRADARAFARGQTDRFGAWQLVERTDLSSSSGVEDGPQGQPVGRKNAEALFHSKDTGTASWFKVEPTGSGTRFLFGSWVGGIGDSGWKALMRAHVWYSRFLLRGV
ncbi:MAG: hypothetical protein AAFN48_08645 [Pseudomonadota bacterium]